MQPAFWFWAVFSALVWWPLPAAVVGLILVDQVLSRIPWYTLSTEFGDTVGTVLHMKITIYFRRWHPFYWVYRLLLWAVAWS